MNANFWVGLESGFWAMANIFIDNPLKSILTLRMANRTTDERLSKLDTQIVAFQYAVVGFAIVIGVKLGVKLEVI